MESMLWSKWTDKLRESSLKGIVLTILEGAGPLKFVLSQCMLGLTPFLGTQLTPSWKAFALMLEDPLESRSFADFLRQDTN